MDKYKLKKIVIALPSNYYKARDAHDALEDEFKDQNIGEVGPLRNISSDEYDVDIVLAEGVSIDDTIEMIEGWY